MVWSVVSQVNVKEPIVHTCQPATVVDVKFRVPLWLSYQESMPDDQKFPGKTHVLSENKFHWRLSAYIFIWTKLHCWIYNYTTLVLLFLQGFSIKYIHACTNSRLYGWNWFYKVSRLNFINHLILQTWYWVTCVHQKRDDDNQTPDVHIVLIHITTPHDLETSDCQ